MKTLLTIFEVARPDTKITKIAKFQNNVIPTRTVFKRSPGQNKNKIVYRVKT